MVRCDPKNVAVDWLDAYEAASLNQIVAMHSPDAVIECACGSPKKIRGRKDIADYWRHRFIESPAIGLEVLRVEGGAAAVSYRTSKGIVQAILDVEHDGLITRCRCGPTGHVTAKIDWRYVLGLATTLTLTIGAASILLFAM
jgi:hypothetical protein